MARTTNGAQDQATHELVCGFHKTQENAQAPPKRTDTDPEALVSAGTGGGNPLTSGNTGKKAKFKANVAQLLANTNTFGNNVSELVSKITKAKFD